MRKLLLILFACCVLVSCRDEPEIPEATGLQIVPPEAVLTSSETSGETLTFKAQVFFDDRVEFVDVASWSVSNAFAGRISDDGTFTASTESGGVTWVQARYLGLSAAATVTVQHSKRILDGVSEDAAEAFDDAPVADREGENPEIVYPPDGVFIPRNTSEITFMYDRNRRFDLYRLRFDSEVSHVTVFTDQNLWRPEPALWRAIAATNAGGSTTLQIAGGNIDPGGFGFEGEILQAETPVTLNISRLDAPGSIYYWSATEGGIKRIPFGGTGSENFYLQANNGGRCVSCHTVSPDGSRIAITWDGGNGELGILSTADPFAGSQPMGSGRGYTANFKTFSPDGNLLIASQGGYLKLYDAWTGNFLQDIGVDRPVSHPEWSPDGDRIVVSLPPDWNEAANDWYFAPTGQIGLIRYDPVVGFSQTVEVIYDPQDGRNSYYPIFSPDGRFIAFNRSTGDCTDDVDAELWLMGRDGERPVLLTAANQGANLTNSWPRWAPLPDADLLWLTFSSKREYGWLSSGIPQIWVSAIDPKVAAVGEDPSAPAFWLPGQNTAGHNHIPAWGL